MPRRDWYPPPSRPRPADGIKARSRRGAIGETWWSRRFVEVLESLGWGARLQRGRRYARAGQVLALDVSPGEVAAAVQGSRAEPYRVKIRMLALAEKDWARAETAMAAKAAFSARLLAGEMPHDIEEAFADCHLSLFPASAKDLAADCTCPDWANPCKHVAAVYYLLAEAFDDDPFLILRWRGRDRDTLLERLRELRGATKATDPAVAPEMPTSTVALPVDPRGFWDAGDGLEDVPVGLEAADPPDALLLELRSPGISVRGEELADIAARAYPAIVQHALSRAYGTEGAESNEG